MPRLLSIFEGKEAQRARVEAKILERNEQFRASPTVKIGRLTVINPTFEGPNPFKVPGLLDPANEGVLIESQRARVEAKIVQRSEEFKASPTVKIGEVTVINPTFEGPNPFKVAGLSDPENEGILETSAQAPFDPDTVRSGTRRSRAKSEAYKKTPWPLDEGRTTQSLRNSAPPLSTVPEYVFDDDPFRKDPLSGSSTAPNSFFLEDEKRKRRRTVGSVDYL
ncbi:hypothetical protein DFH06DRAFT_1156992 [Mycena polygramma]|nr:hypothetical protein DFH06DRAFT_1156992 [Mycena polygramma]